nr:uncharacterized protein LOC106680298 isoform X2 [Halyomorpha halys]
MVARVLFAVLLWHAASAARLQDDLFGEAISNINKYNSEHQNQKLEFKNSKFDFFFFDFSTRKVQLGDLSTIQVKSGTQSPTSRNKREAKSQIKMLGNIDYNTTYYYSAMLELKDFFTQYDYDLKYLHFFTSSGTVAATGDHFFKVGGSVKIDSDKHCQADVSSMNVQIGSLQATVTPDGWFHFILKPFVQYLTNAHLQDILPIEDQIAYYIQTSIPKSKFSELVCDAFNK